MVPGLPDVTQIEEVVGLRWRGQQVVQCLPSTSTQVHDDKLASVSVKRETCRNSILLITRASAEKLCSGQRILWHVHRRQKVGTERFISSNTCLCTSAAKPLWDCPATISYTGSVLAAAALASRGATLQNAQARTCFYGPRALRSAVTKHGNCPSASDPT